MKLYFISQDENRGYDTYSDAVVAAENEADARATHPSGNPDVEWGKPYGTWCNSPDQVRAELIGEAVPGTQAGVICSSFRAG